MSVEVKRLIKQIVNGNTKSVAQALFIAEVTDVQAETCTVKIDEFEIPEVRLKATISEKEDKLVASPKVGSFVLIGSLNGDYSEMAVLVADEVEKLEYQQNNLKITIDSSDGKVSIQNDEVSLLELFQDLKDLISALKVTTPAGPSTNLLPDSQKALMQFETRFKKLLK